MKTTRLCTLARAKSIFCVCVCVFVRVEMPKSYVDRDILITICTFLKFRNVKLGPKIFEISS